eukprot:768268-Hanusia_phi.AAC.3
MQRAPRSSAGIIQELNRMALRPLAVGWDGASDSVPNYRDHPPARWHGSLSPESPSAADDRIGPTVPPATVAVIVTDGDRTVLRYRGPAGGGEPARPRRTVL